MSEDHEPVEVDAAAERHQRAEYWLDELHNAADHVDAVSASAQVALKNGDPKRALEHLKAAERSAGLIEMLYGDAIKALAKAGGSAG